MQKLLAIGAIIALFFILLSLGFWQLDRAQQKKHIEQLVYKAQQQEAIVFNNNINLVNKNYHLLKLTGRYNNNIQFIYDNQIHNKQAGYNVLTAFNLVNSSKTILINRGFIPWGNDRNKLASINVKDNLMAIIVKINIPKIRPELKDTLTNPIKYPLIIQSLNLDKLAKISKLNLYSVIGLLEKNQQHGFIRQWQPFYSSVDKHIGYAVQWFLMAIVLVIISFYWFVKKPKK